MEPEKTPFLENGVREGNGPARRSPFRSRVFLLFCINGIMVVVNLFTFLMLTMSYQNHYINAFISSPARHALQYEKKVFTTDPATERFIGPPSPAIDNAWNAFMQNSAFRVNSDELPPNSTSIQIDGSGYLATFAVYHQLHCVNWVRRNLYEAYYFPNETSGEQRARLEHTDHCLETLRQSAMCSADISLYVFEWQEDIPEVQPYEVNDCISWASVENWVASRHINGELVK